MRLVLLFVLAAGMQWQALAQEPEIFSKSGVAINGYDPVAYFKESKPVKGTKENTYRWKGAEWRFASKENLAAFKAAPEKYAPRYGGYCAYGVADDHTAPTKPDAWTIVDGKLYLNYNLDVRGLWRKKQDEYIKQANTNWPAVLEK